MYLCYIDESGVPSVPGNTSHYILAGFSIPVRKWKQCDRDIEAVKIKYDLKNKEVHVAWILRKYFEQSKIQDFDKLSYRERRSRVMAYRNAELLRLQKTNITLYRQTQKNYRKTEAYVHLTFAERRQLVHDLATVLAGWQFARLFAECVDKIHFDPSRVKHTIDEQSFEQVVSRFQQFLQSRDTADIKNFGLLIHDNNETVAKKHTFLMREYHKAGTLWTRLENIIETPLFVDSELTGMVQMADLCAYALRRYLENQEEALFDLVFQRADRRGNSVVGVRHFSNGACSCKICSGHRRIA